MFMLRLEETREPRGSYRAYEVSICSTTETVMHKFRIELELPVVSFHSGASAEQAASKSLIVVPLIMNHQHTMYSVMYLNTYDDVVGLRTSIHMT